MISRVWAVIAAAGCGIGVATASGAHVSSWAYLTLLAALAAGTVTTVGSSIANNYRRGWRETQHSSLREDAPSPITEREVVRDREVVREISALLPARDLDWLGSESFEGVWGGDRVTRLRELGTLEASRSGIFDPELVNALGDLVGRVRKFLTLHDETTIVDPIMRDGAWRMIGLQGPTGDLVVQADADRVAIEIRLRHAAAEIVEGYGVLVAFAIRRSQPA